MWFRRSRRDRWGGRRGSGCGRGWGVGGSGVTTTGNRVGSCAGMDGHRAGYGIWRTEGERKLIIQYNGIIMYVWHTIFSRNLTTARFNFKSLHPAARFRGRRLVHSPASRLLSMVRIARVRLHSAYLESDDPFPCGEILRAAFIGTNLLIGGISRNTVLVYAWQRASAIGKGSPA